MARPIFNEKQAILLKLPLVIVGLLLLLWVAFLIREVIIAVLLACVMASALYPPVAWLQKRNLPKKLGIGLFYLLFLVIAAGCIFLLSDALMEQGQAFIQALPGYVDSLNRLIDRLPLLEGGDALLRDLTNNLESLGSRAFSVLQSTFDYMLTVLHALANVIVILVLAFFLLSDTEHFHQAFLKLFPKVHHARVTSLLERLSSKIGSYVRGQLIIMLIVGVGIWLGMLVLGIPYALLLGLISFVLEIIPMLGPIVATVFGVLVTLGHDPSLLIWTLLVYFVAQQLESYFLTPKILGDSVGLHPMWVLLSVLIGGLLLGVPGVLLAVPGAVLVQMLIEEFYIKGFISAAQDNAERNKPHIEKI